MAKGKGKSADMVSPMYQDGRMNGPVYGPKAGRSPKDPLDYKNLSDHLPVPKGKPSDRGGDVSPN